MTEWPILLYGKILSDSASAWSVQDKDDRLSEDQGRSIHDWITDNAERYWLTANRPFRNAEEGGADIIICVVGSDVASVVMALRQIDDPQMPGLIPVIKKMTPGWSGT